MKKAFHIIARCIGLLLILLLAGLVAIQSPRVQTWIGRQVIERLKGASDARISFSEITVRPFDAIVLRDLLVEDPAPAVEGMDTLAYIRSLSAKFSIKGLFKGSGLYLNRLQIDGGCFHYGVETDSLAPNGSSANYRRIFGLPYPEGKPLHWGKVLDAGTLLVRDFSFRYASIPARIKQAERGIEHAAGTVDWADFTVDIRQIEARNIRVNDDLVSGDVRALSFRERRSGFDVLSLSTQKVQVGKGRVSLPELNIVLPNTDLRLASFTMDGPLDDYDQFEEKIRLDARIRPGSRIDIQDLKAFSSSLASMTFRGTLQGNVSGPVCDLRFKNVEIAHADTRVLLHVDGSLTGLPDVEQTRLNLQLQPLRFQLADLGPFVSAWAPETQFSLERFAPGTLFGFSGKVQGPINAMQVKGDLDSGIGDVRMDIVIRHVLEQDRQIVIGGRVQTKNLDLKPLTGIAALGPVTLRSSLEARFGQESPEVRIDTLLVQRLHAMNYDYTALSAAGTFSEEAFNGRIIAADPNLKFMFQGLFNLSRRTRNAAYQFYASLGYADLHALHLDSRERSKISFEAASNFIRTEDHDLLGDVSLYNISLDSDTGVHELGDLNIKAHANDDVHRIHLQSGYLDATYVGNRSAGRFISDLKSLVLDRELSALSRQASRRWDGGSYEATFRVGAAQDLLAFLVPGLWIENKTQGSLRIDADGKVDAQISSGRIALYDKYVKDLKLDFNNADDALQATLSSSAISVGSAQLRDNRLSLYADDNHIGLGYSFDNEEEAATRAELYFSGDLARDNDGLSVVFRTLPSNLYYQGNGWGLRSGDIQYKGGKLHIDTLQASHEDELLLIDGGYSPTDADTLTIRMEKFDIGIVNTFTGGSPALEGSATGRALVVSPAAPSPGLLAFITCDSTRISGHPAGRLQVASSWDEEKKRFNLSVRNRLHGVSPIDANGYVVPATRELHAEATLDQVDLGYAEGLLSGLFSDFGGALSGKLRVDGSIDNPRIVSEDLRIENGRMELDYLRVPYRMEGLLSLDENGLRFKDVRISDGQKGSGEIIGGIYFRNFKDLVMDTHLNIRDIHVLSLQPGMNPTLSGSVYGSGRVDITGPLSNLLLNVDASISDESTIRIPTGIGGNDSSRDLLTFTEVYEAPEEDEYEQMMLTTQKEKAKAGNVAVQIRIRATPDLKVYLDMDENSINASGNGTVELATDLKDGGFSLNGDYTLTGGNVHFSVMNLVTRDFIIQDGSTIRFNGDVWNTDLNVDAVYVTKASLSTLLSDESASSRRTVNCGININGKLSNPEVKFSIDIPDLNPSVQTQVESVLNTDDKIQKQFVYLLLAGNFLPGEDSGISANGSDVLFSNVSSIMSGQLNNIFQKLDIPLDLGLNYQSTQTGSNLFDVALSTQLFNNRVLVNGTVGNKELVGGTATNEIAGDIDIEIKLNRSGTLRLTVFSHSADQFTYFLDNSQRHGAGIAYQRDFNSIRQFFRELFHPRRRQERRADAEAAARRQRNVVLQIDSTGQAIPIEL